MVERARAANQAGLDSLFVGDHHSTGTYYQNVPIMGRLLAEWDERPAGTLFLLPLWHPVLVAEQIGTLASIAQGPFIMQCAIGGGDEQFDAFGVSLKERPSRFEAALDVVRRLCAGDKVSTEGPFVISGARFKPIPPQPLEVWIGARAPAAVDRAARLGDAFLIGPEATVAEVKSLVATYREACERHGRAPGPIAVRRDVHLADTQEAARALGEPAVASDHRGFDPSVFAIGTVESITEQFAELGRLGCSEVLIRHFVPNQDAVLRSFELLGDVRRAVR